VLIKIKNSIAFNVSKRYFSLIMEISERLKREIDKCPLLWGGMGGFFLKCALPVLILFLCADANSQYVNFGRNKVQYNDFDWHTLSTEHFKVYYYPEMKELAEIGAAYAEEWYNIHRQDFNYSIADTTPIIYFSGKPTPRPV